MKFSKILLTTDISDHAREAFGCAADLASKFLAKLHLVEEASGPSTLDSIDVQPRPQRHRRTRSHQRSLERDLQGLNVTWETAQGFPSQQVAHRPNHIPANLVLLRKREGLGGVARSLTCEAKCSVLTVPVTDAED